MVTDVSRLVGQDGSVSLEHKLTLTKYVRVVAFDIAPNITVILHHMFMDIFELLRGCRAVYIRHKLCRMLHKSSHSRQVNNISIYRFVNAISEPHYHNKSPNENQCYGDGDTDAWKTTQQLRGS